ncbi:MAG: transcriptional regulator [Clostridiales bacterium]|jgi:putative transcriptional regulator|nr:transcriptional regulator [Clostridiales bacterium]
MHNKLYKLRRKYNLSQEEIAKTLGISRSYYGHIETGERKPGLILARKIANYFDTTIENIFFNDNCYKKKH